VTPGKTRWLRISLRSALIVFTCVAIAMGWCARYAQRRKEAFAAIRKAGGDVRFAVGDESRRLVQWFGAEVFGQATRIDLRQGKADNDLLTQLGKLTEIRGLDLSGAEIDDEGLRQIAHLPLSELWLQSTKITDKSAATISKIKTLDFLQLNATSVSNEFLEQLQSMPALAKLGLRGTQVTGAGMKFLSRHPKLTQVDVYHTEVDDAGVRYLADCKALEDVGLSMTRVTNGVFEHLHLLPKLMKADLSANRKITTEAVLAFEASHPQCDIEWYGN
jgi:Leucine Rich Repeat (LRR) protein